MRWGGWQKEHLDDVPPHSTTTRFPHQKSCDHEKKSLMEANHFLKSSPG